MVVEVSLERSHQRILFYIIVFLKLIGVWFVNQSILSGKKKVQLIELGPGRGTLASDMLRVSN